MTLKIPHLHTGDDGQSHWGEIEIAFNPVAAWGNRPDMGFTGYHEAKGIRFRLAPPGADTGWTRAPQRQYVITLSGEVEYEIGDGSRRRFGPGSIFLADDTTGQGHVSRGVGDGPRLCAYIPLTAAAKVDPAGLP